MNNIVFSICIPTYNSEKTLPFTLESIKNQNYDLSKVEVFLLDGGSSDRTLEIAKQYDFVKICENEKRLPEYAKLKFLGLAIGKYFVQMDSDEAFSHNDVLKERIAAFSDNPSAHILVANKLRYVKGYGVAGTYLNVCGDPFSYFIYNNKGEILKTFKQNIVKVSNNCHLLTFGENEKKPIADGGTTTFDLDFLRCHYSDKFKDISFATSIGDKIFAISNDCLCIKSDDVLHRSKSQFKQYLKKIKFRIINNIFAPEESGFSSRNVSKQYKKYLFPLYAISFILPLIDSIKLSISCKDISMMLHILYVYYTTFWIAFYMMLKIFNVKKYNKEY